MPTPTAYETALQTVADSGIVATDYDGCLSPLHDIAEEAWRARGALPALQQLGAAPGITVIAISGRPRRLTAEGKRGIEDFLRTDNVHDLDPRTGANTVGTEIPVAVFDHSGMGYALDGGRRGEISIIANHGADLDPRLVQPDNPELESLRERLFAPMSERDAAIRGQLLTELPLALQAAFPEIPIADEALPGAIYLEVKPEGIAVHTRILNQTQPEQAARVLAFAEEFYRSSASTWDHPLHATPGSNVLDIQVRPASKGRPLIYLKQALPGQPICYIGDDITDIAAMRELGIGDTAIVVGDRIRAALEEQPLADGVNVLRLEGPTELATFLGDAAVTAYQPKDAPTGTAEGHRTAVPRPGVRTGPPARRTSRSRRP